MDYVAASTAAALLSEVPPPGCEVPVISDVYLQGVDGFFLYHNMFDAATLAAERVQAPVTYNGGLDPLVANDFNFI